MLVQGERTVQFRGDERDLMEILGNLLDNAYKYGDAHIIVHPSQRRPVYKFRD